MRDSLVVLALLIAGVSSSLFKSSSPASSSKSAPTKTAPAATTQSNKAPKDSPLRPLIDFLNAPKETDLSCPGAPISAGKATLKFVIATVVDPGRTRLSLALDRQLEAIMRASQNAGFQFQDAWLPWNTNELTKEEIAAREQLPGMLMFRQSETVLVVWLVGETPTAGISREQYRSASCFIQRFGSREVEGVVGPTFSGTLESLRKVLQEEKTILPKKIVSGTVTGPQAIQRFCDDFSRFQPLLYNDKQQQEMLKARMRRQRIVDKSTDPLQVVVLAEGDTQFGKEVEAIARATTAASEVTSEGKPTCGPKTPENADANSAQYSGDVITYPREISRLRNAYQSDPSLASAQENPVAARRQLTVTLSDTGQDSLPTYSGQTPSTQEATLFQIAERLKNGRFDTAILTGSNVLDTLFLSQFLTRNVPDIRVVVFDSDLLFVHGDDSLDHLGTLSVSSYPLMPQISKTKPLELFSSMSEQGLYEALTRVLKTPPPGEASPGLWLTVVGRGGYWPIQTLNEVRDPAKDFDPGRPTRVWNTLYWATLLLAVLYAVSCIRAMFSKQPTRLLSEFDPNPEHGQGTQYRTAPMYHLLTTLFVFASLCCLVFPSVIMWLAAGSDPSWFWHSLIGLVMSLALLAVAGISVWRWSDHQVAGGIVCAAVLALATAGWIIAHPANDPNSAAWMRAIRAVNVPSGVAPNIPLLFFFLCLALWSWVNWKRNIFAGERVTTIPVNPAGIPATFPDNACRVARSKVFYGDFTGIVLAAVAAICTIIGERWLGSVESDGYDWAVTVLLAFCSAALLSTAWGFFHLWQELRGFLVVLEADGAKELDAIADKVYWPSFWVSGASRTFRTANSVLETFEALLKDWSHAGIGMKVAAMRDTLNKARTMVANDQSVPAVIPRELNETSNEIAQALMDPKLRLIPAIATPPAHLPLIHEVVGRRYAAFIRYAFLQMRNQVTFITGGFLFLAAATHSYPFQGEGYLRWWLGVLLIVPGILVTVVMWQMTTDPALKKLNKSDGKVDWAAIERFVAAGALPLLAGVSSFFPSVGEFLFSWIHPALTALN